MPRPSRPTPPEPEATDREATPDQDARRDEDERPREVGGVDGPEPTRYGDWERNGRCTDF